MGRCLFFQKLLTDLEPGAERRLAAGFGTSEIKSGS
jgi:hypothetical protein